MPDNNTLHALFSYKEWANHELFEVSFQGAAAHPELLHHCVRTLNHGYCVDRIFRAHLLGEPSPLDATNTVDTPTLSELKDNVSALDRWYVEYVGGLAECAMADALAFNFTDGQAGQMSREEILLHVVLHGTYHRGNVGEMVKLMNMSPPRDLLTKFLHESEPLRRSPRQWRSVKKAYVASSQGCP